MKNYFKNIANYCILVCSFCYSLVAQNQVVLKGNIVGGGDVLTYATILVHGNNEITQSDEKGNFKLSLASAEKYRLEISYLGFATLDTIIYLTSGIDNLRFELTQDLRLIDEVVVTGTMKETTKDKSPVNIDIITPRLFQKTSTPNLFEAAGLINGVRPQNTCNVCNTGEIQINSLGGPYTLVMIDGMPIVSGLASVYGLMGIPVGMINRLEIAKGPASALYGTEAMGGVINIITKDACAEDHKLYLDYYITSWLENNLDLSKKFNLSKDIHLLSGLNVFWYDNPLDKNNDGFTDLAVQKRISFFNKLDIDRSDGRDFSIALRGVTEERWGGQIGWNNSFRGGDSVYAESIKTNRVELISKYQWNLPQRVFTQFSYNYHHQDSYYGLSPFFAKQSTAFIQTYTDFKWNGRHDILVGINYKHLWFDDNTSATFDPITEKNMPQLLHTSGLFIQDEFPLDKFGKHQVLMGMRLDYNNIYKWIPSPRLAYKWSPGWKHIFRFNMGTGFRIVNVFTEDHMALSGARTVIFQEQIEPEKSVNASLSYIGKLPLSNNQLLTFDISSFYYHFTNRIIPDYDTDPNLILYANLDGYAFNRGGALSVQYDPDTKTKFSAGITYTDVQYADRNASGTLEKQRQLFAPRLSGNYQVSHEFGNSGLKADITGSFTGPMRLPVFPNDFRPEFSPWFTILNFQMTKTFSTGWDLYVGCKNLLNFVPYNPLMRPFDPFDKHVDDPVNNPEGFTFDPSYAYASLQGIRFHVGIRRNI
ncbi:MAG: TonB-dependent receptor plug domain-containing protein [Saprospiraceae bacterium]|nr:TonB-dependent receptor plug domain-containing protein [Saprospiraceae bacterium]